MNSRIGVPVLWLVLIAPAIVGGGQPAPRWEQTGVLAAPEAHQAAAADGRFVYAIGSTQVAQYDRRTGERVGVSTGEAQHLNSGFLHEGKLYCAHSNYPRRPERSEIKVLDPATMRLATHKDLGNYGGSLTWVVRHEDHWWCNFARYGDDNAETFLVQFDDDWQEIRRWTYPARVIGELGRYSLSGGVWRDGSLLVTGHDDPVLFRLRLPRDGRVLELVEVQSAPFGGQGIAHDPKTGGLVGIRREKRQVVFASAQAATGSSITAPKPNVVLILCDNLGYGDVGCYGSTLHRTPHIDRLAAEGMRFTHAYASSGVCTPSRASLMTGCYPRRVNMHVSDKGKSVLQPVAARGLHPDEITVAELLQSQGYATAIFGKWHLGDQPPFLPTRQGFDTYLGIPYSDDMTARPGQPWPPLPLMQDERVVEAPADRNTLTKRYTEATIEFITAHRDEPFFVYLAHAMPGSTKAPFASEAFRGRSQNGPWGDAVEEIDWSTGEIMQALGRLGLDEKTLVIWTNDNGAPKRNPPQGSNRPLAGWGYDTSEGAMRVPLIARWPGRIPEGQVCDEVCTLMDLYPTLASLAGAKVPQDRVIDGRDIWPLLSGKPGAKSPHEAIYFYFMDQLQAVRSGRWKLYLPLQEPRGRAEKSDTARLYDLRADVDETVNLAERHADVVKRLLNYADAARADLGDGDRPGKHQRPAGHVPNPTPRAREAQSE